jgi:CHAT domain-containing protein/Tfp pilus assembly protein PilF
MIWRHLLPLVALLVVATAHADAPPVSAGTPAAAPVPAPTAAPAPAPGQAAPVPAILPERAREIGAENTAANQLYKQGRYAEAVPHARRALELAEAAFGAEDPFTARFVRQLANVLRAAGNAEQADSLMERARAIRTKAIRTESDATTGLMKEGRYAEAIPHARRALALVEEVFAADDPFTAQFHNQLAIALKNAGRYEEATSLFERVLAIREKALGPDDPLLATSLNNLGAMYSTAGAPARAEPLLRRALAIREKALGPLDPITAITMSNLGGVLEDLGRPAEAVPLHQRAVEIDERVYGADSPETANALNNLAVSQDSLGRYLDALDLYQRALTIREKTLGAEHPDTALSLNNVGFLLERLGRADEAIAMQQRALAIKEKMLGPDHPSTAASLDLLASVYDSAGRFDEALALFQRALAVKERALGADSNDAAISVSRLATLHWERGEYDLALPLAQRALEMARKNLGPEHPLTAERLDNLAVLNSDMGEYHTALILSEQALAIRLRTLGLEHPETAIGISNLAQVYKSLGDDEQAMRLLQQALEIRERMLGPLHPDVALSLNNLAASLIRQHRYEDALPLQRRSLAINEHALGPNHPATATALNNLAALLEDMKRPREALPLYERALAIRSAAFGPVNPDVAASLNNIAALYETLGQAGRALPLYRRALRILKASPDRVVLAAVQSRLGRYYNKRRHGAAGVFYLKLAVNTTQQLRAGALGVDQELQQSLLNRFERSYQNLADYLIDQGRYAEAEQIVAMRKEKEYFEFFHRDAAQDSRVTRATFTGIEEPLAQRFEELGERLSRIGKQKAALLKHGEGEAQQKAMARELEVELAQANRDFDAWFDDVAKARRVDASPQAEEKRSRFLGLGATQATLHRLGQDVALAHYIVFEDKVRILLITPGRATESRIVRDQKTGRELRAEDLGGKIRSYRAVLQDANKDRNLALAKELYELLFEPIEGSLKKAGIATVMLSLDGMLRYLPFGALYDGKQYLVERLRLPMYTDAEVNNLAMAPSKEPWRVWAMGLAKKWCSESEQECPDRNPPALRSVRTEIVKVTCVARAVAQGDAKHPADAVVPLPDALDCAKEEEVASSEPKSGEPLLNMGQAFLDDNFTEERIKEGVAKKYNVLHMATHFVLEDMNDSKLLLGQVKILTLKMIRDELRFDGVDLVTLSACKTGLGEEGEAGQDKARVRSGREVESLGVLVQKQGAQATIATLWEVTDVSAAVLLRNFYQFHRQENVSKSEALRQAQLSLLHGRGEESGYEHPAHWAPFVLMGNWL